MPCVIIVAYVWQILERGESFCSAIREQLHKGPSWIGLNLNTLWSQFVFLKTLLNLISLRHKYIFNSKIYFLAFVDVFPKYSRDLIIFIFSEDFLNHYELIEMSKNNDYTTGNLLDYEDFLNHYKLIAIDLSKQIELENPGFKQHINFIGKLEDDEASMLFINGKSEETTFEFFQNSVNII